MLALKIIGWSLAIGVLGFLLVCHYEDAKTERHWVDARGLMR